MLRITQSPSVKVITVGLEGKLLQPWIEEVRGVLSAARSEGRVRLDLSQLSFADESGLRLLREMQRDGVELSSSTALLTALLERDPIGNH